MSLLASRGPKDYECLYCISKSTPRKMPKCRSRNSTETSPTPVIVSKISDSSYSKKQSI
ncbi:hypothetical protein MXB_484 [Myxobolus squamalis]|nr:hypothetical protein MXB_484 [Myxobolus squamalis]